MITIVYGHSVREVTADTLPELSFSEELVAPEHAELLRGDMRATLQDGGHVYTLVRKKVTTGVFLFTREQRSVPEKRPFLVYRLSASYVIPSLQDDAPGLYRELAELVADSAEQTDPSVRQVIYGDTVLSVASEERRMRFSLSGLVSGLIIGIVIAYAIISVMEKPWVGLGIGAAIALIFAFTFSLAIGSPHREEKLSPDGEKEAEP